MKLQNLFLSLFFLTSLVGCQSVTKEANSKNTKLNMSAEELYAASQANSATSGNSLSSNENKESVLSSSKNTSDSSVSRQSIVKFSEDNESDMPVVDDIEDSETLNSVDDSVLEENPSDYSFDSFSDKSNPLMCNDSLYYGSWVSQFNAQWLAKNSKKHFKKASLRNQALSIARTNEFINLAYPAIEKTPYDLPVVINSQVLSWIAYFTGAGRKNFVVWLERGKTLIPDMEKALERKGLPSDLVYLSMIESGYSTKALSNVGAVGLWQFMPSTGKEYGLKINDYLDERRDVVKSTEAAANYLSDLYSQFRNWHLAAASYNGGPGLISRKLRNFGQDTSFFDLTSKKRINSQTANYVPKILAAMIVAKNSQLFGFETTENIVSTPIKSIPITRSISLEDLSKSIQVDKSILESLNPELRLGITPPAKYTAAGVYNLNVPLSKFDMALASVDTLPDAPTTHLVAARIRHSEKVAAFAKRYKVTLASILQANKSLKPSSSLRNGQVVYISVNLGSGQYDKLTTVKLKHKKYHKEVAHSKKHSHKKFISSKTVKSKKYKSHKVAYKDR